MRYSRAGVLWSEMVQETEIRSTIYFYNTDIHECFHGSLVIIKHKLHYDL